MNEDDRLAECSEKRQPRVRAVRLRLPPMLTRHERAVWELPEGPGAHAKPRRTPA